MWIIFFQSEQEMNKSNSKMYVISLALKILRALCKLHCVFTYFLYCLHCYRNWLTAHLQGFCFTLARTSHRYNSKCKTIALRYDFCVTTICHQITIFFKPPRNNVGSLLSQCSRCRCFPKSGTTGPLHYITYYKLQWVHCRCCFAHQKSLITTIRPITKYIETKLKRCAGMILTRSRSDIFVLLQGQVWNEINLYIYIGYSAIMLSANQYLINQVHLKNPTEVNTVVPCRSPYYEYYN